MKFLHRNCACLMRYGLVTVLLAASAGVAQDVAVPIKNLRMPIEHYEDGSVKTQLKAGYALVPETGTIIASNVVLELFREDASLDAVINAEDCRYDREKSRTESDSRIQIEKDGIVIMGKGFKWYGDKERVKILSMARVLFKRDLSKTRERFKKERDKP